jgi:hypothetical protein
VLPSTRKYARPFTYRAFLDTKDARARCTYKSGLEGRYSLLYSHLLYSSHSSSFSRPQPYLYTIFTMSDSGDNDGHVEQGTSKNKSMLERLGLGRNTTSAGGTAPRRVLMIPTRVNGTDVYSGAGRETGVSYEDAQARYDRIKGGSKAAGSDVSHTVDPSFPVTSSAPRPPPATTPSTENKSYPASSPSSASKLSGDTVNQNRGGNHLGHISGASGPKVNTQKFVNVSGPTSAAGQEYPDGLSSLSLGPRKLGKIRQIRTSNESDIADQPDMEDGIEYISR